MSNVSCAYLVHCKWIKIFALQFVDIFLREMTLIEATSDLLLMDTTDQS